MQDSHRTNAGDYLEHIILLNQREWLLTEISTSYAVRILREGCPTHLQTILHELLSFRGKVLDYLPVAEV